MKRKVRRRGYAYNVILLLLRNCVLAWAGHKLHTLRNIKKFQNFAPDLSKKFLKLTWNLKILRMKFLEIFGT